MRCSASRDSIIVHFFHFRFHLHLHSTLGTATLTLFTPFSPFPFPLLQALHVYPLDPSYLGLYRTRSPNLPSYPAYTLSTPRRIIWRKAVGQVQDLSSEGQACYCFHLFSSLTNIASKHLPSFDFSLHLVLVTRAFASDKQALSRTSIW